MNKKGFTPLKINESMADGIANASAAKIPEIKRSLSLKGPVRDRYRSQMTLSNGAVFTPLEKLKCKTCGTFLTGFTFVELLVSILIFSIIVVSLFSTFRVGLTAYRKGETEASLNQNLRLCLERMALDFRNSYKFSDTQSGFEAQEGKVSFYCLKKINFLKGKKQPQICRIEYSLDEDKLLRAVFFGKLAFSDHLEVKDEVLLKNIAKLAIEFPYKQEQGDEIIWQDYWLEPEALPLGIRINLEIKNPQNPAQPLKITKFVYLPLGKLSEEPEK